MVVVVEGGVVAVLCRHRREKKKGEAAERNRRGMEGNKILFEDKPATASTYLSSPVADHDALKTYYTSYFIRCI